MHLAVYTTTVHTIKVHTMTVHTELETGTSRPLKTPKKKKKDAQNAKYLNQLILITSQYSTQQKLRKNTKHTNKA